jgi:CO/xanthine dehydrogenase Mo-binding subunit
MGAHLQAYALDRREADPEHNKTLVLPSGAVRTVERAAKAAVTDELAVLVVDETGQLQNASFMDYLIPRATDMPPIQVGHLSTPSPLNPLGIKGVGEAGAIPTPPAFIQAVENALAEYGLDIREAPLSPNRLFEIVQAAKETE